MLRLAAALVLAALVVAPAAADEPDPEELVRAAGQTLRTIMTDPRHAVPPEVLADARGVVIFPDKSDLKLVGSAKSEFGVLVVRTAGGAWDRPRFVRRRSTSVGLQARYGHSASVNVYLAAEPLSQVVDRGLTSLTLGAEAGFGTLFDRLKPASRKSSPHPGRQVESYSMGSSVGGGVFASVASLKIDTHAQAAYYSGTSALPASASELMLDLAQYSEGHADADESDAADSSSADFRPAPE